MDQQPGSPDRTTKLVALLAACMGAFIILMSIGVIFPSAKPPEGGRWIGVVVGLAFLLAGIAVLLQTWVAKPDTPEGELPPGTPLWIRLTIFLISLIIVAALAMIASWVAFGPGTRHFTGITLILPNWLDEAVGRTVFGIGAILSWFILVVMALVGTKRLLAGK